MTQITVEKQWIGLADDEEKPDILVELFEKGNKEPVRTAIFKNGRESFTFKQLPKYVLDENGKDTDQEIEYTVKETIIDKKVAKKFKEPTYTYEDGKVVVVNAKKDKVSYTAKKVWVGGPEVKPTIELQLYQNGEAFGETVVLKDGKTTYTWTDLDETDEHGEDYQYTVKEVNVPENYEASIEGNIITNTYVSPRHLKLLRKFGLMDQLKNRRYKFNLNKMVKTMVKLLL